MLLAGSCFNSCLLFRWKFPKKTCFLLCSSSKVLIGGEIESLLIHLSFPLIIQICCQISDSHLVCLCSSWSRPLSFLTPHLPLSASSFEANLLGFGRLTYMISVIILFLGSQLCISEFSSQSFCKSIKLLTWEDWKAEGGMICCCFWVSWNPAVL